MNSLWEELDITLAKRIHGSKKREWNKKKFFYAIRK